MPVRLALRARALNGERPGWDDRRQKLPWVDLREPALHLFDPASGEDTAWQRPAWIGCFSLDRDGYAVVALTTGLYHMNLATGRPISPQGRAEHPDEGGLLTLETPVPGPSPNKFDLGAFP